MKEILSRRGGEKMRRFGKITSKPLAHSFNPLQTRSLAVPPIKQPPYNYPIMAHLVTIVIIIQMTVRQRKKNGTMWKATILTFMRAPRGELLIQQVINGGAELENDSPFPVCSTVARIWIVNGLSARIWA